jgi:hypothetical protein
MTSFTIGPRAAENRRRGRAGARSSGHHHRSRRASRFVEESLIVSEERDLGYLLQLIDGARNWAVHRNIDEYMGEHVRPLGELRERCEALAAEYDAPLPEGDAGLVAAIHARSRIGGPRESTAPRVQHHNGGREGSL